MATLLQRVPMAELYTGSEVMKSDATMKDAVDITPILSWT